MLCHAVFTPDKQAALSTFFFSSLSVPPGQFVLEKRQTSDEVDRRGRATSKGRQTEPPADPVQANALLTLLPSVNVAAAATATQVAATAATSAATETSDSWRGGAVAAQPKAVVVQSHNNSDSQLGQSFNGFSYFFFLLLPYCPGHRQKLWLILLSIHPPCCIAISIWRPKVCHIPADAAAAAFPMFVFATEPPSCSHLLPACHQWMGKLNELGAASMSCENKWAEICVVVVYSLIVVTLGEAWAALLLWQLAN